MVPDQDKLDHALKARQKKYDTFNGKRDDFIREDFYSFETLSPLFTRKKIDQVIDETIEQVSRWKQLAQDHGVPAPLIELIETNLRLKI